MTIWWAGIKKGDISASDWEARRIQDLPFIHSKPLAHSTSTRHNNTPNMSADIKHGAIQELPSDLATNAYQFLAVLSHLPREWIDMNHFKVVREDQWIKALGATRAVGAGYCDFLFGPEAETSFYAAVEVLAGAGLVDIWKSPKGNYLRLTAGIQYEWAHDYAFKDQYYDCGCAILFIAVGLRLNRGVQIMERHMYGCLEIAQRIAMKAEKVLDETKWQFVSLAIAILADGFAARKKYEEAEGLYYLSIASGRGQNSWYPKINRALMLGFAKGDWDSAKGGIEDAVA